jgi:hypothetical protein
VWSVALAIAVGGCLGDEYEELPPPVPVISTRWDQLADALLLRLAAPIKRHLIEVELLDEREAWNYLAKRCDLAIDIDILTKRAVELQHAPRLADLTWQPPPAAAGDALRFNERHEQWLENWAICYSDRDDLISERLSETVKRQRTLRDLAYAHNPANSVIERRRHLLDYRDRVGPAVYYAGRLPMPVPLNGFATID